MKSRAVCCVEAGAVAAVAVCGHELGEDTADHGAEEGERSADDGDIAFCSGPVGGGDVAVFAGISIFLVLCYRMAYKTYQGPLQQYVNWKDEGHW